MPDETSFICNIYVDSTVSINNTDPLLNSDSLKSFTNSKQQWENYYTAQEALNRDFHSNLTTPTDARVFSYQSNFAVIAARIYELADLLHNYYVLEDL